MNLTALLIVFRTISLDTAFPSNGPAHVKTLDINNAPENAGANPKVLAILAT